MLNTPSHHRVHHGTNEAYLDRNHAGILIVWDRMFGTFIPEKEKVVYGLTKIPYEDVSWYRRPVPLALLVAAAPLMLVVHPSIPAKSVPEFVAYAKTSAGKLNFGSGGPGT